ncbi:MAG: hypothetical protein IJ070_01335 [Firmicutes bacterium]|nr:hypothetical protein [Bacillota bacterium]
MEYSLYDLIANSEIDLDEVLLLRHSLSNENFAKCYNKGKFEEYQKLQYTENGEDYFMNKRYILSFVSMRKELRLPGPYSEFVGCYENRGISDDPSLFDPEGFPFPNWYEMIGNGKQHFYDLRLTDIFSDLRNKMIVDYTGYRSIRQKNPEVFKTKKIVLFPEYLQDKYFDKLKVE